MSTRRRRPVSAEDTSPPETIGDPVGEVISAASQSTRTDTQLSQEDQGEDCAESDGDSSLPLTERQRRFVEEYLVDGVGAQAAIRAGYSAHSAAPTAARLLTYAKVRAAVRAAQAARSRRLEITADRVLLEIARIAFGDLRSVASWGPDGLVLIDSLELGDDAAATIAEIKETRTEKQTTLSLKRYDKPKALELLSRHLGLLEQTPANDNGDGPPFDLRVLLRLALDRAAAGRRKPPLIESDPA